MLEKKNTGLLIAVSVAEEAAPLKEILGVEKTSDIGGRPACRAMQGGQSVRLIETGPGAVNAAQGLTAAIEREAPALILMAGIGGGFGEAGMRIGDIGIATLEIYADLGIEANAEDDSLLPLPFDLLHVAGNGFRATFPTDAGLSVRALTILQRKFQSDGIAVIAAPFLTVDTITATDRRAERLYNTHTPCMEAMEGAAAAQVACHYGIPFLEIRSVSNLVGLRDRVSWDIPLACRRSAEAACCFLKEYDRI